VYKRQVLVEPIESDRGIFTEVSLEKAIAKATTVPNPYSPVPSLVCLEQTHNFGKGAVWSLKEMERVSKVAKKHGMALHIDGARLMNAVAATGTSASKFASLSDSIWIDFTKALGAPMGAVLAGSKVFIEEARRYKHIFAGALRQAGIVAAGCLFSLEHHVERLAEDHFHAQVLAGELLETDGVEVANKAPESNMVFFKSTHAKISNQRLLSELRKQGISIGSVGEYIRAVTHLDISRQDINTTIQALRSVLSSN